jgi:hypothetical protein
LHSERGVVHWNGYILAISGGTFGRRLSTKSIRASGAVGVFTMFLVSSLLCKSVLPEEPASDDVTFVSETRARGRLR